MSCLYTSEFLILWCFNATNIIRSKISHFKDFYRRFVKDGICARVYYVYFRVRIYNHLHSEMVYLIVGVLLWLLKPVRGQENWGCQGHQDQYTKSKPLWTNIYLVDNAAPFKKSSTIQTLGYIANGLSIE